MKLRRNHRLAPEPLDPRYPIHGVRVLTGAEYVQEISDMVRNCRVVSGDYRNSPKQEEK